MTQATTAGPVSTMTLRVAHVSPECTVLGPGPRAVVWVQGCSCGCPGCIAPELQPRQGGQDWPVAELVDWVVGLPVRGVTFSGGEPLQQAEALVELVRSLREARPSLDLITYTGYAIEDLLRRGTPAQRWLCTEGLDVLIDGAFLQDLPEAALRGSANQRLIALTARGQAIVDEVHDCGNRLQVVLREGRLFWMGIPPRGFREDLPAALEGLGVRMTEEAWR